MGAFYNYNNLIDFLNDIVRGKKIWSKYGMIHSFTIANILTPLTEGYISLYIRNNNIIQNLNKYNFTLSQFKNIIFSNEVHGIEMYKKKYPNKTSSEILDEWEVLSNEDKNQYLDLGLQLTDQLDIYPSFIFPDIIINPPPEEVLIDEIFNVNEIFRIMTGLHKFIINDEILFHVYYDASKEEYIVTNLSDQISNVKDTEMAINVYIEDNNLLVQNKLDFNFSIKKYSSYN